ncbi:MAG TPA: glycosyltransferase family 4 protein [Flavobacterium sp.]|nr:glycosyltransferase family 4 protein [Flavobacterium sp.]
MPSKAKNILFVTSEFPPLPGGIGNHAFLLSKYLQKNNFKVSVLCDFRSEKEDLEFDAKQNFTIYRTKRNKLTQLNRIKKAFLLVKKNETIICSGKFSLWIGGFLKTIFNAKKFIAVIHGSELRAGGKFSQFLTKWSLSKFDKLIAVSDFTKNYALQINPKLKIEVINNGIEKIEKNEEIEKLKNVNLVTVGNLTFRKGQQNVIKALPLLKEKFPEIHYHCIGIPTEKEKFTKIAKSLNVLDNISFYGTLSDSERNKIVQKSSIFMMLSQMINNDFEGFGIAVLEANALGIPAIGSRDSGIADAINDGFSGILINQEDPKEIEKAISEIINNYSKFSKDVINWSENFEWNNIIKKYLKAIKNEA